MSHVGTEAQMHLVFTLSPDSFYISVVIEGQIITKNSQIGSVVNNNKKLLFHIMSITFINSQGRANFHIKTLCQANTSNKIISFREMFSNNANIYVHIRFDLSVQIFTLKLSRS